MKLYVEFTLHGFISATENDEQFCNIYTFKCVSVELRLDCPFIPLTVSDMMEYI